MSLSCPIESDKKEVITLSHGGGGKDSARLMDELFLPAFTNQHLDKLHDGALLDLPSHKIAFTTDSYVIQPLFFPGGTIGTLAITGTANDLAMCGAKPLFLSCGFIIEEGFLQQDLREIVQSMQKEAERQAVHIVTGDTKVIERHTGRSLFINTSGIGVRIVDYPIDARQIQSGDSILLSGDIGRHGMAVMAKREGLTFSSPLMSDSTPLFPTVEALVNEGISLHCLRDATRGGLATILLELAEKANLEFVIEEERIPVSQEVRNACELLGFDPLYVANEGRFVAFVPEEHTQRALKVMREFSEASCIGKVGTLPSSSVKVKNSFSSHRALYKLSGDQLPRIC